MADNRLSWLLDRGYFWHIQSLAILGSAAGTRLWGPGGEGRFYDGGSGEGTAIRSILVRGLTT